MAAIIIETFRKGYGLNQIRKTMTVGELISFLGDYDEDQPIYLSFDRGYTYGGITESMFDEREGNDDE